MSDADMIAATFKQTGHIDFVVTNVDPFSETRAALSSPARREATPQTHQPRTDGPHEAKSSNTPHTIRESHHSTEQQSARAEKLARASATVAENMNSVFGCAGGVQSALDLIGMHRFSGCGNAWQMGQVLRRSGNFQLVPESEVRRGDIGIQSWSDSTIKAYAPRFHGQNLGDIFVVQAVDHGRIVQTNDHRQMFDPNSKLYDPSQRYFLRILS